MNITSWEKTHGININIHVTNQQTAAFQMYALHATYRGTACNFISTLDMALMVIGLQRHWLTSGSELKWHLLSMFT